MPCSCKGPLHVRSQFLCLSIMPLLLVFSIQVPVPWPSVHSIHWFNLICPAPPWPPALLRIPNLHLELEVLFYYYLFICSLLAIPAALLLFKLWNFHAFHRNVQVHLFSRRFIRHKALEFTKSTCYWFQAGSSLGIWILDCMGICRISCSPSGVLLQVKSAVLDSFFKSNMQKIQVLTFTLLHAHACSVSIARLSIRLICCCSSCRTPYKPGAQYYGLSVWFILPCSLAALSQFQTFDFKFL